MVALKSTIKTIKSEIDQFSHSFDLNLLALKNVLKVQC